MTPANPSLIERLEAAEGGSRELDRLIAEMIDGRVRLVEENREEEPHWRWQWNDKNGLTRGGWYVAIPHYTDSLDAALALAERVLPGWLWAVTNLHPEYSTGFHAEISAEGEWDCTTAHAATPALALCIACLRALADGREWS